ncbi:colanic acid biosynthesis glycosyltransferase WcaL, partial [Limnoraphis robusta CCNP1324]|nr:colanic acid biosynthesis glycosyltransferase WcaL [Limnoraphis robusta CCNP1324]
MLNYHRIAYVLKRYPRFSETFVVNEILAHEAAGIDLDIFALRPTTDSRFQPDIARVKGEVTYLSSGSLRANQLWHQIKPFLANRDEALFDVAGALDTNGEEVCQALELAQSVQQRGITHLHA